MSLSVDDPRRRIIVALDVPDFDQALALVEELRDEVGMFKLGLEAIHADVARRLMSNNIRCGVARAFVDAKLHDIPTTVHNAAAEIVRNIRVAMLNLHATGGRAMMEAAVAGVQAGTPMGLPCPKLLAVTILTSLDAADLEEVGITLAQDATVTDLVVRLAKLAQSCGCDGVICSPYDIGPVRRACGDDFLIVARDVYPRWAMRDEKDLVRPREAIAIGADYLVIGRPITHPPDGKSKAEAVSKIADEIAYGLKDREVVAAFHATK